MMGDISEMMLDGTIDAETGEYLGDENLEKYGTESPGFPIITSQSDIGDLRKKLSCPECGKKVKWIGLRMHRRDVHGENKGD